MPLQIVNATDWTATTTQNDHLIKLAGLDFGVQSGSKAWSLISSDNNNLRFEVRSGDQWVYDNSVKERSEIAEYNPINNGTPIHVAYDFQMEPGAKNTANWSVFGQFHQNDYAGAPALSPPFAIGMSGDKMTISLGYTDPATGLSVQKIVWTDTQDTVRGKYYHIDIQVEFDPSGKAGHLHVVRDGAVLYDYSGPLGYTSQSSVYWKEGIYRASAPETLAVDYKNLSITTGAEALATAATTTATVATSAAGAVTAALTTTASTVTSLAASASSTTSTTPTTPAATSSSASTVTVNTSIVAPVASKLMAAPADVVATASPIVTITPTLVNDTGTAGDLISSQGPVKLAGQAVAGAVVVVTDGAATLGRATADAKGAWSLSATLAEGSHLLTATATATDRSVATATATKAVVIDTHAPDAPAFTGVVGGSAPTNGVMYASSGAMVLQGAAEAGSTVQVYLGGKVFGSTTANAAGTWMLDARGTTLTGDSFFYAKAVDAAGNASGYSAVGAVRIDTVAPTLAVKTFAATTAGVTVAGNTESLATITFSENGAVASKVAAASNGVWSASLAATSGVHTYTLTATDLAGNVADLGHNVTVGGAAADIISVKGAGDTVFTGAGADVVLMAAGTVNGTVLMDFTPNVDRIQLTGFDSTHAAVTRVDSTHWQVSDGAHSEVFVVYSAATLHSNDWVFG